MVQYDGSAFALLEGWGEGKAMCTVFVPQRATRWESL